MCGIWGYQFVKEPVLIRGTMTRRSILTSLLMYSMEARGTDSWGFALRTDVEADVGITVIKDVGPCTKLVDPQLIASCHQVMGHTRKASAGSVCKNNAHPFRVKHIIGMHNGSVSNQKELNAKYRRDCDVDSEHIFHHLADGENMAELCVQGAAVWVDTATPDTIHFLRSHAGQLSIRGVRVHGPTNTGNTEGIVWASTDVDLERAVAMAGYDSINFTMSGEEHHQATGGKLARYEKIAFSLTATPVSNTPYPRGGVSTTYYNVWEKHPVLGTQCCCDRKDGLVIKWHLDSPTDQALIKKWQEGTLTQADVPVGNPHVTTDGVITLARAGVLGDTCTTCKVFCEYTYMAWDDKAEGFVCWNCDPTAAGYCV